MYKSIYMTLNSKYTTVKSGVYLTPPHTVPNPRTYENPPPPPTMCFFVCSLSVVFFLKLYFLENLCIINQLTNLQTTVLRVFILFLFVLKRNSMLFLLSQKHPYFSAAILFSLLDRYELTSVW